MFSEGELPFPSIGDFLDERGFDVKALRESLNEYDKEFGEELKMMDHYGDPLPWLAAVGYREVVEAFLRII